MWAVLIIFKAAHIFACAPRDSRFLKVREMLLDLDNTLVDRAAAFNSWARDFVINLGRPTSDAEWLIKADRDGYESRIALAQAIRNQFRLNTSVTDLVNQLLYENVSAMKVDIATTGALKEPGITAGTSPL